MFLGFVFSCFCKVAFVWIGGKVLPRP